MSGGEYVPSINEIRADYVRDHTRHFDAYQVGHSRTVEEESWGAAFDQALAAHDARIASEAAERGWDAAVASMRYEDGSRVELVAVVNPYRADRLANEREGTGKEGAE